MGVVGIIAARGGSKGIPMKSLAPCAGRPLLAYTSDAARGSKTLDRIIVSTDSPEIAAAARELGVEAPFIRPAHLASDDAPMLGVLRHALDFLAANGEAPTLLVLLQPTSPLREASDIDGAVRLCVDKKAETVVSVVEVPHQFNPVSVMKMDGGVLAPYVPAAAPILRRQDKPVLFARNGPAVLAVRPAVLARGQLYGNPTLGYVMPAERSIDVDDELDLIFAEAILSSRGSHPRRS